MIPQDLAGRLHALAKSEDSVSTSVPSSEDSRSLGRGDDSPISMRTTNCSNDEDTLFRKRASTEAPEEFEATLVRSSSSSLLRRSPSQVCVVVEESGLRLDRTVGANKCWMPKINDKRQGGTLSFIEFGRIAKVELGSQGFSVLITFAARRSSGRLSVREIMPQDTSCMICFDSSETQATFHQMLQNEVYKYGLMEIEKAREQLDASQARLATCLQNS